MYLISKFIKYILQEEKVKMLFIPQYTGLTIQDFIEFTKDK